LQQLRQQLGRWVYAVHRLDKGTSGVLLFALTPEVGRRLSAMFADQIVEKTYLAIVRGHPPETGVIDQALQPLDEGGALPTAPKNAVTHFRRLAEIELPHAVDRYPTSRYALVELQPLTGRRHQLRRHMKHISHPIIGDATYGKGRHNRLFRDLFGSDRLLLACVVLRLPHPVTGESLRCSAPLEKGFADVVERLGWSAQVRQR